MNGGKTTTSHGFIRRGGRTAAAMVLAGMAVGTAGCELVTDEFREAAVPALETGVDSILDGLVDGFFAVADPDGTTTTDEP